MNKKIIFSLFTLVLLFGLIGVVLSAGETITTTIEKGTMKEIFSNIFGNGIDVASGENGKTLSFLDEGSVNLSGALFEDIKAGSVIELDNSGGIKFANLTATDNTIFTFGENNYKLAKGDNIIYKGGKVTFEGGKTVDYKLASSKDFTKVNLLGKSLDFEKNANGDTIIKGNFKIGSDEFKGLGEGKVGGITYSKSTGKISNILTGTDATIKGANFKVTGSNLNLYYDENFVSSSHNGENYFNYGKNKISAGGTGFSSDLGKSNNMFGDMQATKVVKGIGTKTRDLSFTLNGGNLEISKDTSKSDLTFNVKGNGEYIMNNGKYSIYSQKYFEIKDGKRVLSDEEKIFIKTDFSKKLASSYDLNLNGGEYLSESNLLKDKNGKIIVNTNTDWEDTVMVARDTTSSEANSIRSKMIEEGKLIYTDDPYFLDWIKSPNGDTITKQIYSAAESANKNKYGVKISPSELYSAMKGEGWGYKPMETDVKTIESYSTPKDWKDFPIFDIYPEYPDKQVDIGNVNVGLSGSIEESTKKKLEEEGFIPKNMEFTPNIEYYMGGQGQVGTYMKAKDTFDYFAGVYAKNKYLFQEDFKKLYGENEFNKLSEDEVVYWTTYYFNAGSGSLALGNGGAGALKNREKNYIQSWKADEEGLPNAGQQGYYNNPKFQSRLRTDFFSYVRALGLFNYI